MASTALPAIFGGGDGEGEGEGDGDGDGRDGDTDLARFGGLLGTTKVAEPQVRSDPEPLFLEMSSLGHHTICVMNLNLCLCMGSINRSRFRSFLDLLARLGNVRAFTDAQGSLDTFGGLGEASDVSGDPSKTPVNLRGPSGTF